MTNIKDYKCVNVYDAGANSKEVLTCMKYNQEMIAIYCSDSINCDYFKPKNNTESEKEQRAQFVYSYEDMKRPSEEAKHHIADDNKMTRPEEKKYERWEYYALQGIERDIKDHVREQQSQNGISTKVKDVINNPNHYTQGKIEVWDFISDQKLNYNRGCIIKYVCRAGIKAKETELEDLKKAVNYLEKEIKEVSK